MCVFVWLFSPEILILYSISQSFGSVFVVVFNKKSFISSLKSLITKFSELIVFPSRKVSSLLLLFSSRIKFVILFLRFDFLFYFMSKKKFRFMNYA